MPFINCLHLYYKEFRVHEQMSQKAIKVNGTEILLLKSPRSRYMSITVKPFVGVRITIPERVSFDEGEKLAHSKIKWIEKHVDKMRGCEESYTVFHENSTFQTRNHRLELKATKECKISARVTNGLILVKFPFGMDPKSSDIQKVIRKGIENAYREEAKEYLPKRLNDLSDKHSLPFKELFIKNIKSRWGSCSGKNNINLSIHLMILPDHLIDYVILHELAHTKVKNHSKKYWDFLGYLTTDARRTDRELKKHRIWLS